MARTIRHSAALIGGAAWNLMGVLYDEPEHLQIHGEVRTDDFLQFGDTTA